MWFSAAAGIRIAIAVFLGAVTWMMVTWEQNPFREDWLPTTVPIEVTHLPNGVVEVGKPGDVRVRLRAAQDAWTQIQPSDFKASIDASHLSAGIQSADIKIESSRDYEVVDWQPRRATIRLEPLATRNIPVQLQVSGKLPDGYLLIGQTVSPEEVSVSGEQDLVDTLAQASVSTSLDGVRGDVTETSTPKLVDDKGQPVANLQFSPASIRVSLAVDRQVGSKTVPVRVATTGQVASGYWLSSFSVNPQTVTITGGPAALSQVEYIDLPPLDLTDAKADISRTTPLSAGAGYSLVGDVSVEVKAAIQPLRTTEVLPIGVAVQGIPPGLNAQLSPANIEVTIGGLVPALSALKPGDVSAVVDASGLSVGPHVLPVRLNAPGSVSLDATRPDRVTVTLAPPATETPTPEASPTVAAAAASSASASAQASASASPRASASPVATVPNGSPTAAPPASASPTAASGGKT